MFTTKQVYFFTSFEVLVPFMDMDSAIAGMAKSINNPVVYRLGNLVVEVALF